MKRFKIAFMSVLAVATAFCCSSLFAEENKYIGANGGSWFDDANWSLTRAPEASDDVVIESCTVFATDTASLAKEEPIKVNSLTLNGANLTIGDKSTHVHPVITGDVKLEGLSGLYVSAGEISESYYDSVFDSVEHTLTALRANANIVTIGGDFIVKGTSVVYPEAAVLTGVPVVFKVAGGFTVEEGAKFDATGRGWGWKDGKWSECPHQSVCKPGRSYANVNDGAGWTLAIGAGMEYGYGGVYGGNKDFYIFQNKLFFGSYGPTFAPLFPGSPGGSAGVAANVRGSGSIVVLAQGAAVINGILTADSVKKHNSCASGGGIWLAASKFTFGENAKLTAKGLEPSRNIYGAGGGGRIAIAEGCSAAQIDAMFDGRWPEGVIEMSNITDVAVDVTGGYGCVDAEPKQVDGSLSTVCPGSTLTTQSNVDNLIAEGVTWGEELISAGPHERTAPQYAFWAADATIRYTCQGYVVSNATEQIAEGPGLTASVEINGTDGPFTLTWLWGDRTEVEPDPVSRHWVGGSSGALLDPQNWEPVGVPTRVDELYVTNATVAATSVKVAKLVLSGGSLAVGSNTTREDVEFSVTGDVMVCDGATLFICAPLKTDPAGYTSIDDARMLLWRNRTKAIVGGAFTIAEGSTVQVSNHPETGDLLVFEVGSFDLAAGGTMTAAGGGFTWLPSAGKTLPEGTIRLESKAKFNNESQTSCYTYGFGTAIGWQGTGYAEPGGHGYSGRRPYGLDFAPFEPGSPGDAEKNSTASYGGGSIVVLAQGAVSLAGTLNADGALSGSMAGPSGGSIWIAGDTIAYGAGLVATARGAAHSHNAYGAGDGGRITFMTDVTTAEQVETMVGGTKLEGFTYGALTLAGVSVDGGRRNPADAQPAGKVGTAVSAFSNASYERVTVTASPLEAVSSKANYGEFQFRGGETVVREADVIGGDPVDPQNVRYVCTGYVVSNATEQVAAGETTTLSFPVVKGAGPYTVTWLWNVRQTRTQLGVSGPGAATVNGQAVSELWVADTEGVTFTATADAGKAFWTWSGADVPQSDVAKTTFAISSAMPHEVCAVFVDPTATAKTCTLKTTAGGDFYNPENWENALVPNPQDAVVIPGGVCTALGRFVCGSLTMTGGSLAISQVEEIAIPGDVTLSGSSVLTVTAVPTNGTATAYADGATRVAIGGNLVLADTASVKPVSDSWTGGSVAFTVAGDFTLGASAKFDAVGAGWSWVEYADAPSPLALATVAMGGKTYQTMAVGHGSSYNVGGSYGGRGGSNSGTTTYGFANAPFYPGSPAGRYSTSDLYSGGGLIRIHVGGKATVNGMLDASGNSNYFGGTSGGGIWLTAAEFAFGETAQLLAHGGKSAYSSQGGGGRIAIGTRLTAGQMASLLATGKCVRRAKDIELFAKDFPGVTVNLERGVNIGTWGTDGEPGTFSYYPPPKGLMLLIY